MTDTERQQLEQKIAEWRKIAAPVGPMHSLWDVISDAESLLAGEPTIMRGSPAEVFKQLMEIE